MLHLVNFQDNQKRARIFDADVRRKCGRRRLQTMLSQFRFLEHITRKLGVELLRLKRKIEENPGIASNIGVMKEIKGYREKAYGKQKILL